jgi:hypothetical protein
LAPKRLQNDPDEPRPPSPSFSRRFESDSRMAGIRENATIASSAAAATNTSTRGCNPTLRKYGIPQAAFGNQAEQPGDGNGSRRDREGRGCRGQDYALGHELPHQTAHGRAHHRAYHGLPLAAFGADQQQARHIHVR